MSKTKEIKPSPIKSKEVSNIKMVAGNEKKFTKVIHNKHIKKWVGIGWVTERKATKVDYKTIPEVVE